ncbi:Panacea domain-containing protein [Corallococcus interemptor]|uniref:SocA family protein n=1 Tax=Corallococcus TaxID=83461 RepID=UPI001CBB2BB1|nr:SocA family protein [Corallococcus sp. AS-1-6]MBZ4374966.1 SocA family protein [Corallococcus sp. AS-1-6]
MAGDIPGSRLPELVQLICSWAAVRGEELTKLRLVKFLYLADLYHARKTGGRTLTGWPWKFVSFGPYCAESLQAVDQAHARGLIFRRGYESKYTNDEQFLYGGKVVQSELPVEGLLDSFSTYTTVMLKQAVKKWGDDTAGLLTHVYFETEPMEDIEPSNFLDFRKAVPPPKVERVPAVNLSAPKKKKALELIASLTKRSRSDAQATPLDTGPHDEAFLQAVSIEDVSDGLPEFSGVVVFGDLRQPNGDA